LCCWFETLTAYWKVKREDDKKKEILNQESTAFYNLIDTGKTLFGKNGT